MKRKLPKEDSPEAVELRRAWNAASADDKYSLAAQWGVQKGTLANFVMGVNLPQEKEDTAYPSFDILPPPDVHRAEEDMVLVLTDWHMGKVTSSYNADIAAQRVRYLTERVLSIIALHRPIRRLYVLVLGDMVQGENPHQGSKIEEVASAVRRQIKVFLIPAISSLLVSCSQVVESVEVYGVRGNHGKYDKIAPESSNWDLFFYDMLEMALCNQEQIHVYPASNFYQLVNVRGWRLFIIHGDQVDARNGIPLFAMRRKMQDWYAHVGGFHYAFAGHFHSASSDQVNSVADYSICPPLVTGDSWALEKVGRASRPVQLCFGIHSKYGRTWEYRLYADEKYLPTPFNEPEGEVSVSA